MEDRPAYVPLTEGAFMAMRCLDPEQVKDLVCLIQDYAFDGIEPTESGPAAAVFQAIRPGIDRALENLRKKREAGRKRHGGTGSSSKQEQTPADASTSQQTSAGASTSEQTPAIEKEIEVEVKTPPPKRGEGGSRGGGAPQTPKRAPRFSAPTFEEVAAYGDAWASERGAPPGAFKAESFMAYYERNGWKVGRNAMKDWQAAVRGWILRDHPELERKREEVHDVFSAYA